MVLVEDAYVSAKYSTRFSWLVELEEHDKRRNSILLANTAANEAPANVESTVDNASLQLK